MSNRTIKASLSNFRLYCGNILSFEHTKFGSIRIGGTPIKPMFVASDVWGALGYMKQPISEHCMYAQKWAISNTVNPEEYEELYFIPSSDVYQLIKKSNLSESEASEYRAWIDKLRAEIKS